MGATAAFFMQNIVYVYFFYGLAFFGMGLVVLLESGRASEFRFARALLPFALFGFLHGAHEWYEMFQIFAAHETGHVAGTAEEVIRITLLAASFLALLVFGTRLLPGAEDNPRLSAWQVAMMALLWLTAVAFVALRYSPSLSESLVAADVLARYSLAIPGAVLAAWALLRERRDFHARGMSQYGQALLWASLAFVIFGVIGQLFTRPSIVFPSQVVNTAFFLRTFGIPVQLLRGLAAVAIAITLGSALRAFELEGRLRLGRANKARIEAQAAALEAQQRRADEVEALNLRLEDLVRQLVNAQEGERQRIARELHDETGQKLTALGMGLAAVDNQLAGGDAERAARLLKDLRELNDQAITELRNIMADLRPAQLDDLGLVPALRWYVQQYQARHPELVVTLAADRGLRRLPSQHETVLFRTAQEALTNIARHAHATEVAVTLSEAADAVCLEVKDDGAGFDMAAPPRHEPGSGLGLVGMRERVALVGGSCTIESEPGRGTRVLVALSAAR
jgi:signal transduction histidine kinase